MGSNMKVMARISHSVSGLLLSGEMARFVLYGWRDDVIRNGIAHEGDKEKTPKSLNM